MAIRAENDPKYSRRFLFMGLAAIAFAGWFLYDGLVTYPHQRERALVLQELLKEGRLDDWDAVARERGWPTSTSGLDEPKEPAEITMQFVMAGIVALVALMLLSIPIRTRGRWIEGDDKGITSSWGESFGYEQVLELNKRQWRSKGIAKVTYQDGNRRRRFVIDDYKFDRYPTDDILYQLEQHIDLDKITHGPPEPPPEAEYEEAGAAADDGSADEGEVPR